MYSEAFVAVFRSIFSRTPKHGFRSPKHALCISKHILTRVKREKQCGDSSFVFVFTRAPVQDLYNYTQGVEIGFVI